MAGAIKRKWRRRSREEWREVFARHGSSGLSVTTFCARESISVSSFQRWRALVAPVSGAADARTPARQAAFVDLGVLGSGSASRLELKLDLGGGVVLHLVRG
ncbi:IS66 family insertion sequence element accessory protein TnpA [Aromatoleum anaerobium]|uniref:IS66 family insertion sequence element accessory protein TnpB n=1 Tax=Aromatoleum anaerobium TaxID=182180 RepID=A0ABX1PUR4_9RHOO|nr:IS66 family insertion sequence element accessory protein TnpB [Aromatoleum anaerobium]MCK0505324.1 IS66 family insertion sequence element accessory protein TnpB [Aromatoleum anaerobium]MCK0505436.1 IS66 family insertion sequence element accessory protein TnpB [Aromatoleum anaerobium]MCK0508197.1 IS66 family insertion sequence element accessory protein TnpB [Aromatoleum anaerobium]